MAPPRLRRVVTGHNPAGQSIIQSDHFVQGERFTLAWTTGHQSSANQDDFDGGKRDLGLALEGGTVFRIGELELGTRSRMHRTKPIDYGIGLEGEFDMEVDGGETVHLRGRHGRPAMHESGLD